MKALIVGAADDFCADRLIKNDGDLLIAADGGYAKIADKTIIDLVVGDFDSLGYCPDAKKVIRLKPEKDETDTDCAAEYAAEHGADEIVFYACLGGRPDHALANLQLGTRLAKRGKKVRFESTGYTVYFIKDGCLRLSARERGRISVFSPDVTRGVTIKGLKYEITDKMLTNVFALGVSNEFVGKDAEISAKDGVLIIFVYEEDNNIRS